MNPATRFRLSTLYALQYVVPGAVMPIMTLYLVDSLGFSAMQAGKIQAMPAFASLLSPFIVAHVADRWMSAERLMGLCHALAGIAMLLLARQATYPAFFWMYLIWGLLFIPTYGLSNAVGMHHIDSPRDWAGVRVWGTVAWAVVAWAFPLLWLRHEGTKLADALTLSAYASFALAAYLVWLPRGHARWATEERPSIFRAFRAFKQHRVAVMCGLTLFIGIIDRFYYYGASPYLRSLGHEPEHIMPLMSLGQMTEVIMMAPLGVFFLPWLGFKRVMLLGVLAEAFRYAVFAFFGDTWLLYPALAIHGVCFAFYFTATYIFLDLECDPDVRSGTQQIFNALIMGVGVTGGYLLGGALGQWFSLDGGVHIDYRYFWGIPAAISLALAFALAVLLPEPRTVRREAYAE